MSAATILYDDSIVNAPVSSWQPINRLAEVTDFINTLPPDKRPAAQQLLDKRREVVSGNAGIAYWYPEFNGMVIYHVLSSNWIQFQGFAGKRSKADFCYTFNNIEELNDLVENWQKYHTQYVREAALKRTQKAAWRHGLQSGDILYASWGYEQTTVDYYQVVGLQGESMVRLRPIEQEVSYITSMSGKCVPLPDRFIGEEILLRTPKPSNSSDSNACVVIIDDVRTAFLIKPEIVVDEYKVFSPQRWSSSY